MCNQDELFEKFREADMKAGQNVDANDIMSDEEINEFGIDIIKKYAIQQGYKILKEYFFIISGTQLIIEKDEQTYYVMVKTGIADGSHLLYDKFTALTVYFDANPNNAKVLFAGVGLYCIGYGFAMVRNKEFKIDFRGFEEVDVLALYPEHVMFYEKFNRIYNNLDTNKKPKPEVEERVKKWISDNQNSVIVSKLRAKEIVNIPDLDINIDHQIVTDLMTIYPKLIYDVTY